jgi:hypothetical protein
MVCLDHDCASQQIEQTPPVACNRIFQIVFHYGTRGNYQGQIQPRQNVFLLFKAGGAD